MIKRLSVVLAVCVAAVLLVLPFAEGCAGPSVAPGPTGTPIKIGLLGPMAYEQGYRMEWVANIARDEINAAGGIKVGNAKRPVEFVKVDTNEFDSVPDAVSATERAISVEKCDFLMGGQRSEAVIAQQEVFADHNKIFMGICAADMKLTQRVKDNKSRYMGFFRVGPFNSLQIANLIFLQTQMVGSQLKQALGSDKLKAAIVLSNLVYNDPVAKLGETTLPKFGIDVVGTWRPSAMASDITAELIAIKNAGAQMIWMSSNEEWSYALSKGITDLNIPVAVVGANGRAQMGAYWKTTGGKCNYESTICQFCAQVAFTPKSKPFNDEFLKRYNDYPAPEGFVYDATYLLKEAIEKAGTLDSTAVAQAMEKLDYQGAMGRVVFDESHEIKWGPGFTTGGVTQWVDSKRQAIFPAEWPNCPPEWKGVKYEGIQQYVVPPRVLEYWKGKKIA